MEQKNIDHSKKHQKKHRPSIYVNTSEYDQSFLQYCKIMLDTGDKLLKATLALPLEMEELEAELKKTVDSLLPKALRATVIEMSRRHDEDTASGMSTDHPDEVLNQAVDLLKGAIQRRFHMVTKSMRDHPSEQGELIRNEFKTIKERMQLEKQLNTPENLAALRNNKPSGHH